MTERRVIELDEHGNVTMADDYDDTELRLLIDEARKASSGVQEAELHLYRVVEQLRAIGASWSVIGSVVAMTRGGAQKKFSTPLIQYDEVHEIRRPERSLKEQVSPGGRWSGPPWQHAGDMVDGTELLDGLTAEMSDRAVVKHLSRGGPTVKTLDALSYLENRIRMRDLVLPGRSHSESERLLRKADIRLRY